MGPLEAAVMRNYNLLKELVMPLTLREVSILAVAVTMLQSSGINPFETEVIVQVDRVLVGVVEEF